mmetsp:Transcript_8770/g.37055  ORF Transcript_8770/g.37055 Transcript_8770/m.37055 type:complete len:241 (-) Transcript_8770:3897-4619(-)
MAVNPSLYVGNAKKTPSSVLARSLETRFSPRSFTTRASALASGTSLSIETFFCPARSAAANASATARGAGASSAALYVLTFESKNAFDDDAFESASQGVASSSSSAKRALAQRIATTSRTWHRATNVLEKREERLRGALPEELLDFESNLTSFVSVSVPRAAASRRLRRGPYTPPRRKTRRRTFLDPPDVFSQRANASHARSASSRARVFAVVGTQTEVSSTTLPKWSPYTPVLLRYASH